MTEPREENSRQTSVENLALQGGLAIVLVKNEEADVILRANNNSICANLYNSPEFAPRCAHFCGSAFRDAVRAEATVSVKCHAGLHYDAVPLDLGESRQLVAIVGRTYLKSEEYKNAADRARSGDWQRFPTAELFANVLLGSSKREIEKMTGQLSKIIKKERDYFTGIAENGETFKENETQKSEIFGAAENFPSVGASKGKVSVMTEESHNSGQTTKAVESLSRKNPGEAEEFAAWRAVFGSLLELDYHNARQAVVNFLARRYALKNLAWLENANGKLERVLATGDFAGQPFEISLAANDALLLAAIENESALELRERTVGDQNTEAPTVNLFPVAVGGSVMSALLVGDQLAREETKRQIARFVQKVSSELEILRLREQIERQTRTTKAIRKLNESLRGETDEDEFWNAAAQISAELLRSERGSLLVVDNADYSFTVKAAVGSRAEIIKGEAAGEIGKRIARQVLESGKPLIVRDARRENIPTAPAEWKYRSNSFISYPIIIGGRKIGVLNVTDPVDGATYNETDLELLQTISPQLAIALDRTALQREAVALRQISITDPLTNLLNRRYLEERLAEETNRSRRHNYQMSFMMIDVDDFKSYNDKFSHPEGDKALQIVGQCLRATLRGADVAARYGGEEFSILLPQTSINEAFVIAERLRRSVAAAKFPHRQVTISIGIANCTAKMCSARDLLTAADKALYRAKKQGRNNVQIYRETDFLNRTAGEGAK